MPEFAHLGAIAFTFALVFYSVGIWAEFWVKRLKPWHVWAFFAGVVTDSLGTWFMAAHVGGFAFNAHSAVGALGLGLMIAHLLWASGVLARGYYAHDAAGTEKAIVTFHKYSVGVWAIWMIAYLSGVAQGMQAA